MKKKIISAAAFWLVVILLFNAISNILIPTWNEKAGMPLVRTNDFYAQKEDTMDAMVFGSSYSYYSVSPLPIWTNYGITSYSFGNPSQRIWTTYYYMEEACKTQSPKVMLYEVGTAYMTEPRGDGQNRQNIDPLPMSMTKLKAIYEITKRSNETVGSYLLPGLRYHSRWKELTEEDFSKGEEQAYYGRGSLMRFGAKPAKAKKVKKWMSDTGENMTFPEENEKYVDMMLELCEKNDAELVFVRFPDVNWTMNHHNMMQELADKKSVKFLDFNMFPEEYGLDWNTDTTDYGSHMNVEGNTKVSNYLGQWLKDNYGFEDKRENPEYQDWVDNAEKFNRIYDKNSIANIIDIDEYLEKIQNECYTVVMSVKGNMTQGMTEETKKNLLSLGLSEKKIMKNGNSYIAVLDGGELVAEKCGQEYLIWQSIVGDIKVEAESAGTAYGDTALIKIDEKQYATKRAGLNIVVYDKDLQKVVDSVAFNIKNNTMRRKMQKNNQIEY